MACQLGLTSGLLLNNRRDEVADRFALLPVCPGQEKRDIIAQTSRERVLRCHTQRLSQGLSSCLLVTSENVSRHQDNTHKELSKYPWRMDDEKMVYPFYEKCLK